MGKERSNSYYKSGKVLLIAAFLSLVTTVASAENSLVCLAHTLYHESRGESIVGNQAVAAVVFNRLESNVFPNTICEIVKAKGQFPWFGKKEIRNKKDWQAAIVLANNFLLAYNYGQFVDPTNGAIFFHATYVDPWWNKLKAMEKTIKIDKHIFYKMEVNEKAKEERNGQKRTN